MMVPVPVMIKQAVQALDDDLSWKIIEQLADRGKSTWQDLLESVGKPKTDVFAYRL